MKRKPDWWVFAFCICFSLYIGLMLGVLAGKKVGQVEAIKGRIKYEQVIKSDTTYKKIK